MAADDLDYAENTTGTFGSGWTPGGSPGVAPASKSGPQIPGAAPQGAPVRANDAAVMARIGGGANRTPGMTVDQMHAQNDFDRRMGFKVTHSDEDIAAAAKLINPSQPAGAPASMTPGANSEKAPNGASGPISPLDVIGQPPISLGGPLQASYPTLQGTVSGQDVPPGPEARAGEAVGGAYRTAVGAERRAERAVTGAVSSIGVPDLAGARERALNPPGAGGPSEPILDVPGAVKGFVSGFQTGAGGSKVAAGATNATAAQFEKPTKANPTPVTPTTPVKNIDKSKEALGRFGMSDDEFRRRQFAFSGFR